MRECRRILLSRVWLGVLVLLLVCHAGLFLRTQSDHAGGSLRAYAEETERWGKTLSALPTETGAALLDKSLQSVESWNAAWEYNYNDVIDDSWAESFREEYPDFDDKVRAIRLGAEVENGREEANALIAWQERLTYQSGYADDIASVAAQAQRIRSNPLFARSGSFDFRNAERTEADYTAVADVPLTLAADDAVNAYLNDNSALIFSLCLMIVTVVLILEPRRLGMEQVERSAANGRSVLTLWRLGTVALSALIAALAMQGSSLLLGVAAYRQPLDLSVSIQSFAFFRHWTAKTTLGGFLLWHILFRWAGLALAGLLFWLLLARIRSLPVGLVVCGGVLLLEYHWFSSYGVNDAGYPLASYNIFHLLAPEALAGRYLNYSLFGYPVRERTLMAVVLGLLLALSAGALLATAHWARGARRLNFLARLIQRVGEKLRSKRRPRPLWLYEARKALIYCGGIVLLCAASAFVWTRPVPVNYQGREEALLTQFVQLYAGDLSTETYDEISEKRVQADAEYKKAANSDSLTLEYMAARSSALEQLQERYHDLLTRQAAGERSLKLVDEQPLERIYGYTGQSFRLSCACAVLLGLCLTMPGFFSIEHRNGMNLTLLSAARGRKTLWHKKAAVALGCTVFLWLMWTVRELWLLHGIGIRWDSLAAAGSSIGYWDAGMNALSLWLDLVLFYLLRLAGLLGAWGGMLWLSAHLPALLSAGGIGAAVLLLPALLSLTGAAWLEKLSWASALAGDGLSFRWSKLLWLVLWLCVGTAGAVLSEKRWMRERA